MSDPHGQKRGKVPLKRFLQDLRTNLTDQELMRKYDLSAQAYVSLIKALLQKKYISQQDLARRKEINVKRDLMRESQFLATLCICPQCGHPHPEPFETCPACGAKMVSHPCEEVLVSMSTIGVEVPASELPTGPSGSLQESEDLTQSVVVEGIEEVDEEPALQNGSKPEKKPSAMQTVRSILNKKIF
ncbi:MAG: zinc ribbon domain-containing protein [Desulfomonile sp.]|nr:zinc ribbon domain-containing protein [Desulfomonile sp.]